MAYEVMRNPLFIELQQAILGQRITIANLYQLLPEWEPRTHKDYERMRDKVLNPWIRRWMEDEKLIQKMQKANFALFAAVLCHDSSFEKLCTVAKYFAWYFVWDDTLKYSVFDCGTLQLNPSAASGYREASLAYFRHVLLRDGDFPDLSMFSTELQKALHCWDEVGEHICQECNCCQLLLDRMLEYVGSVDTIDSLFSDGKIPNLETYWKRREHTAAVHCVIATIPFAYGIDVSRSVLDNKNMALLWKHASYIVHITNDMFSFRKEFNNGQLENMIPILMANIGVNCNQAMQLSYRICRQEVEGFNANANRLLKDKNESSRQISRAFIEGCKDVFMGLIHWSYNGERYFKAIEIGSNHFIRFQINPPSYQAVNTEGAKVAGPGPGAAAVGGSGTV
ncbi:hypothetical protein ARAM_006753 [Aspergillus rambellii]|uniref:Terpene synthase n=1 Tax=Aspergillus rambellii TaxID=308745 RepID=A0A0F8UQJ3_9EURO|nr:hypothetical protein ARAM_006753 [Aspergillus rambellii]